MQPIVKTELIRSRAVRPGTQTAASQAKVERIPALDFTKGALVLFMVLYHWINYFIGPQWAYYRYLRFLTPSFIFISGFMISNVYLSKYDPADSRLSRRLFTRGLKLVAIFLALNVGRYCILQGLSNRIQMSLILFEPGLLYSTFVTGDFTSKVVAFYILVPIAYLLMLSAALILMHMTYKYTFHICCIVLLLAAFAFRMIGGGSQNLEMVAIGILGVLAGFVPVSQINKVVHRPHLLLPAYLIYVVAITIWNVPYVLEISGTCLTVMILYAVGSVDFNPQVIRDEIILLGKYSLFAYISQIAILQFLEVFLRHVNQEDVKLFISACAGFALTVVSVKALDRARVKAKRVDNLYRSVFN